MKRKTKKVGYMLHSNINIKIIIFFVFTVKPFFTTAIGMSTLSSNAVQYCQYSTYCIQCYVSTPPQKVIFFTVVRAFRAEPKLHHAHCYGLRLVSKCIFVLSTVLYNLQCRRDILYTVTLYNVHIPTHEPRMRQLVRQERKAFLLVVSLNSDRYFIQYSSYRKITTFILYTIR